MSKMLGLDRGHLDGHEAERHRKERHRERPDVGDERVVPKQESGEEYAWEGR